MEKETKIKGIDLISYLNHILLVVIICQTFTTFTTKQSKNLLLSPKKVDGGLVTSSHIIQTW